METDSLTDTPICIYAVADIHGKKDRAETIEQIVQRFRPHAVVMAGDLTQYFRSRPIIELIDRLPVPVLGVRGNSDFKSTGRQLDDCSNFTLLSHTPAPIRSIAFHGFNGTLPLPFVTRTGMGEARDVETMIAHCQSPHILVAHPPPRGTLDKVGGRFSAGSHGIAKCIRATRPMVMICGHIHEQAGWALRNETLVVNCAMGPENAGALITLEKNRAVAIRPLKHARDDGKEIRLNR